MKALEWEEPSARLNEEFAEYLKDKSVAIVGAANLCSMGDGRLIDAHDVVVRVHSTIPYGAPKMKWDCPPFVPVALQSDLGKKTHVFYGKIKGGTEKWVNEVIDAFRADGGTFWCVDYYENAFSNNAGMSSLIVNQFHAVRHLTMDHFQNALRTLGSKPLAGTLAIADILRHDIKSAYLTGFPCFFSTDTPQGRNKFGHDSRNDLRFIRDMTQSGSIVSVDKTMMSLFKRFL